MQHICKIPIFYGALHLYIVLEVSVCDYSAPNPIQSSQANNYIARVFECVLIILGCEITRDV